MTPTVSFIVPVFNGAPWVERALTALKMGAIHGARRLLRPTPGFPYIPLLTVDCPAHGTLGCQKSRALMWVFWMLMTGWRMISLCYC